MVRVCSERRRIKEEAERARLASIQASHDSATAIGYAWRCSVAIRWRYYLHWLKCAHDAIKATAAAKLVRYMRVALFRYRIDRRAGERKTRQLRALNWRRQTAWLKYVAAAKLQALVRRRAADIEVKRVYGVTIHRAIHGTIAFVSNFFVPIGYNISGPPVPKSATWLAPWLAPQAAPGTAVGVGAAKEEAGEDVELTVGRLVTATLRVQHHFGLVRLGRLLARRRRVLEAMLYAALWGQKNGRRNAVMKKWGNDIDRLREAYYARLLREEEMRTLKVRSINSTVY
jgi:hypothetical protein